MHEVVQLKGSQRSQFLLDHSSGQGVQSVGRQFLEFRRSADAAEKVMAGGVQGVLLAGVL